LYQVVREKKIAWKVGSIGIIKLIMINPSEKYYEKGLLLSTGERVEADVILLCTGFKIGIPFLPEVVRKKLL
jgi:hypothetical protein